MVMAGSTFYAWQGIYLFVFPRLYFLFFYSYLLEFTFYFFVFPPSLPSSFFPLLLSYIYTFFCFLLLLFTLPTTFFSTSSFSIRIRVFLRKDFFFTWNFFACFFFFPFHKKWGHHAFSFYVFSFLNSLHQVLIIRIGNRTDGSFLFFFLFCAHNHICFSSFFLQLYYI